MCVFVSQMELVADDIDGMHKLAKALGRSKSDKEDDDATLKTFLVKVCLSFRKTCVIYVRYSFRYIV